MGLSPGTRFGAYEIVALVGAGGMGEVFQGRDPRLKREVAIKVLPDLFARDPERLSRFEREAQLLASLHHPNIASIFGLEEADGVPALVLEFVDGPTLADRIAHGALSIDEAVRIAVEIAAALEAAHEKGIIHRDLKPANIKLTRDGHVKVLDFGLAKALADDTSPDPAHSPTVTAVGTRAGIILGTAAYMSPEQARGQLLDARTDIWSFGCVLYELLTGRMAFGGATVSDSVAAIIGREPDWNALPTDTLEGVRRALRRCLTKDRSRRLHHIADVRLDLEESPARAARPHRSAFTQWVPWGVAAAAMLAAVVVFSQRGRAPGGNMPVDVGMEAVTHDVGLTTMPVISQDGRLLAYASDRMGRGDLDIWVQLADAEPLRLTDDPADDQNPEFSPDGTQIAFRSERMGGGVYVVPALGGAARLIAAQGRNPRFSPDGSRIAYWTGLVRGGALARSSAFVVSLAGGAPTRLLPDFETARDPMWAPDGNSLLIAAAPGGAATGEDLDWWWVPLDGGAPVRTRAAQTPTVMSALLSTVSGQWTRQGVLFSDGRDLWRISVSEAGGRVRPPPDRLTFGAGHHDYPRASGDGDIVFASALAQRVIERASLTGDPNDTAGVVRLYEDSRPDFGRASQSADGATIVFERGLQRGREIWIRETLTGRERRVLRVGSMNLLNATVSPDGSRVTYTQDRNGFVVDAAAGVPRPLCTSCTTNGFLSNSRDVLTIDASDRRAIRVVESDTGRAADVVLTRDGTLTRPHASPDDRLVAFVVQRQNVSKSYVAPFTIGAPPPPERWAQVVEPTESGRPCGWSPDARTLYLLLDTDGFRCLWGQRVEASGALAGTPFPVRHFHGVNDSSFGTSFGNAITAQGFLYEGLRMTANIWMLRRSVPR